jgi:TRAP-type C4-dicarboxylate transport system permease small subunit
MSDQNAAPGQTFPARSRFASALAIFHSTLCWISRICIVLTGIALIVMTVIFSWLVYGRYVLNATPTWVEQVSLLLVVLITFLGAATGIHENTHLGVSYFRELSPPPLRKIFTIISHFTMLAFGVVMAVSGYKLAVFKWGNLIPLLDVPEGVRAIPLTLCGCFIALFSIGHLISMAQGIEEQSSLTE